MASSNGAGDKSLLEILKSNDRPISEAVEAFTNPINAAIKRGNEDENEKSFWKAWHDVTTIAQQINHSQQERLVDFVNEIRKQRGPLKDDGSKAKLWGKETSWESLPLLGPELRECWNKGKIKSLSLSRLVLNLSQHRKIQKRSTKAG